MNYRIHLSSMDYRKTLPWAVSYFESDTEYKSIFVKSIKCEAASYTAYDEKRNLFYVACEGTLTIENDEAIIK